jgi:hypothetical protein
MKKTTKSRKAELRCPECGKTFTAPQGLSGHMRYIHPAQPASKTLDSQPEPPTAATAVSASEHDGVAPVAAPSANGVQEHLKAAVAALKQRQQEIERDLTHLHALQVEKERIANELHAVTAALEVFQR